MINELTSLSILENFCSWVSGSIWEFKTVGRKGGTSLFFQEVTEILKDFVSNANDLYNYSQISLYKFELKQLSVGKKKKLSQIESRVHSYNFNQEELKVISHSGVNNVGTSDLTNHFQAQIGQIKIKIDEMSK